MPKPNVGDKVKDKDGKEVGEVVYVLTDDDLARLDSIRQAPGEEEVEVPDPPEFDENGKIKNGGRVKTKKMKLKDATELMEKVAGRGKKGVVVTPNGSSWY